MINMRNKPTRFYSDRQEKAVAKAVNGKKQANSGASTFQKGDVKNDHFLIECKTTMTSKQSFSIKKEWLDKIQAESLGMRKEGFALCFQFDPDTNQRYYIIPEKLFRLLNDYMEEDK